MKIARRTFKVEVPSVAMGDIAFNLLIFFVILARAQDDSHLEWQAADTTKVEGVERAKVSVVLDVDGKIHLNGQEISQGALASAIEEQLADAPAGERIVMLKIDKNAQANRFQPLLEAVSEAGGEMVHILDKKEPRS